MGLTILQMLRSNFDLGTIMYHITTPSRLCTLGETHYRRIHDYEPQTTICYLTTPNIACNYSERYFIDGCFNAESPEAPMHIQAKFRYALQALKLKPYIYFTLALPSLSTGLSKKLWLYLEESQDLDHHRIYHFKYKSELRSELHIAINGTFISTSL